LLQCSYSRIGKSISKLAWYSFKGFLFFAWVVPAIF
jgi:hypothetical protein